MNNGYFKALCVLTAFVITLLLCRYLNEWLGKRELGIRSDLIYAPVKKEEEKEKKNNYVTQMGGLFAVAGVFAATVIFTAVYSLVSSNGVMGINIRVSYITVYLTGGVALALFCGSIGLLDDWIKVFRGKENFVAEWQRVGLYAVVAACYLLTLRLGDDIFFDWIYLLNGRYIEGNVFLYILALPLTVIVVNGAVMSEEIDGVLPITASSALMPFIVYSIAHRFDYSGVSMMSFALLGGMMALAFFNVHPVKLHVGKGGAAFAGGMLCAVALGMKTPYLLIPAAAVFIAQPVYAHAMTLWAKMPLRRDGGVRIKNDTIIRRMRASGRSDAGIFKLLTGISLVINILLCLVILIVSAAAKNWLM